MSNHASQFLRIQIRAAASSDAHRIAGLIGELGYPLDPAVTTRRVDRILNGDSSRILVADDGRDLVGMLAISRHEWLSRVHPVARITELVVTANSRRQGVGKRLVDTAIASARIDGCELVELTTNMQRTEAQAFYESLGFRRTSYRFKLELLS